MKVLLLLLPVLLLAGTASAQTSTNSEATEAPKVTVTRVRWRQEVFIPALYDDPMRVNQDQTDLLRDQRATAQANASRARTGQTPLPTPTKKIASNTPVGSTPMGTPLGDEPAGNQNLPAQEDPGPSSTHYLYEATIKNSGEKTIRMVVWQYLLLDPATEVELGRHRFMSKVNIRAGKTSNLVARSKTPPGRVIVAAKPNKESTAKETDQVIIDRLEFDDGSFWQRPEK